MIIYGSMTNNSVGKLFIAGIIPGILLSGSFMLWILLSSLVRGGARVHEPVPLPDRIRLLRHLAEPVLVFGAVMGSLYLGIATATESAAVGVVIGLALTALRGRLT